MGPQKNDPNTRNETTRSYTDDHRTDDRRAAIRSLCSELLNIRSMLRYGSLSLEVIRAEGFLSWTNLVCAKIRDHIREIDRGEKPPFALAGKREKRALIIEARMVAPDKDSGSHRLFALMKIIKELGFDAFFLPANMEYESRYVLLLEQNGIHVPRADEVLSVESFLRRFGRHFNVILLSRADVATWLLEPAKRYAPNARIIFDTVDLHFVREQRQAEVSGSATLLEAARRRRHQELTAIRSADITLVVSPFEAQLVKNFVPDAQVHIVSNIHEVQDDITPFEERNGIVFIGGFEHAPNVDAVIYYVKEILPHIRAQLESPATTYIVGSNPPVEITGLACDDLVITGYVEDLGPYLNGCRVSVAPLRYGAGVKGKVNLSMSYGLPVVASSIAAEGAYLKNGHDVLIADDPALFAEHVVNLYRNSSLWYCLSKNGLQNVKEHFSPQTARDALAGILGAND